MQSKEIRRKENTVFAAIIGLGFDALIFIVALILTYVRDISNIEHIRIINIGMDVVGMLTGLVIQVCCYIDLKRGIPDYKYFRYMVHTAFVGIFADIGGWLVDGVPSLRLFNYLDNLIFYLFTPIMVYFFWLYIKQLIGHWDSFVEKIDIFIKAGVLIEVILCLSNVAGGVLFSIDETGTYVRGPLYMVFMLFIFVSMFSVVLIVVMRRNWFSKRQVAVILIFILTPIPTVLLSMLVYGISVNNVMCMMDTLVMYAVLNIEQGRQKLAVQKELSTAASIQEGVLPSSFPLFPERSEFDVYASMDPAREIGGDFYDAFLTDEDHLALVVGDVAGKGIPAALFMLMARTLIKSRAQLGGTPAEIVKDVNVRLFEDNKAKMFVTIWLAIVDLKTGHVMEVNAGHECPAIRRAGGDFELIRTRHDLVVGGRKKAVFHDIEYDLAPQDEIFIYTDGVPEASDAQRKMYGTDRMIAALNANKDDTPEELLIHVRKSVDDFVGDADQFDDLTMLAFIYKG